MTAAAAFLTAEKETLARAITDALYADMPSLLEKYGDEGRAKCLQDMRYTLEHLTPAVELRDPPLFGAYAVWLRDLLAARNIPVAEVKRCLELTGEIVARHRRLADDPIVAECVRAGLRAFEEGPARA